MERRFGNISGAGKKPVQILLKAKYPRFFTGVLSKSERAVAEIEEFENHCWKDIIPAEDYETYMSYRRETHIGSRPALLVVDLHNLVYKGGQRPPHEISSTYPGTCGVFAHNAIEPTKKLLAASRSAQIPIFYVAGRYSAGRVRSTRRSGPSVVKQDYEIFEAFEPRAEDIVFRKKRASAFFGTPLVAHLVQAGIDSLIICGESTSGCVRASVMDAFSYGFHVTLVEECVFDRSELIHKVNLFDMHHKYADVMKIKEVVKRLEILVS